MRFNQIIFVVLTIFFSVSCSKDVQKFVIEGTVSDADSLTLYLEQRTINKVVTIDSLKLDKAGKFRFEHNASTNPEFYLLKLGDQLINVAIDSTETILIETNNKNFGSDYSIRGSETNNSIKALTLLQYKVNREMTSLHSKLRKKEISESEYWLAVTALSNEYRDLATKIIFSNLQSSAAYFALFQRIGDFLFFDPYAKDDYKLFAAVATSWDQNYPTSPRTDQLKNFTLQAMKVRKQEEKVPADLEAATVSSQEFFNVELPNIKNELVSLQSLQGKIIILDFTTYQSEFSPAHNIQLNTLYTKYKDRVEIYQVSFDPDKHLWRNAASNIPWVAVHDGRSLNSPLITKFNIQAIPSIYLFDKEGQIVKRIESMDELDVEIGKIL